MASCISHGISTSTSRMYPIDPFSSYLDMKSDVKIPKSVTHSNPCTGIGSDRAAPYKLQTKISVNSRDKKKPNLVGYYFNTGFIIK